MGQSIRQRKVASSIEKWLHSIIVQAPYQALFEGVRITSVEMSGDLSQARIWVLSGEGELNKTRLKGMNAVAQTLRYDLAKQLAVKKVPALRFCSDALLAEQERVSSVLHDLFPNGLDDEHD